MSTRFGRYTLLEPLGAGGMAEVWRARVDGVEGFSRELVIKRIRGALAAQGNFAQLFAREARLSARLHHANIVQVFDYGEVEHEPYLALEFVDGLDLSKLMRARPGPLPTALAAYVAREVGRALQCVHEACDEAGQPLGLVHRDVSPSNVMLGVDGSVKLFDFGIARASGDSSLTDQGTFRGKIGYTAPEVVEGAPHDARADLFGLGVLLYELLAGQRLFTGANDAQVLQRVHAAAVPLLSSVAPGVPGALELVAHRLLARLPGDRYESAQQFVDAIDPIVLELQAGPQQLGALVRELRPRTPATTQRPEVAREVLTSPEIERSPLAPPPPRRRAGLALGLGVLGVLLVAGTLAWRGLAQPAPAPLAEPSLSPPAVAAAPSPEPPAAQRAREPEAPLDAGAAPHVEVRSVPSGATVKTVQGVVLGSTPWRTQGPLPARVVLERAGFQSSVVPLQVDQPSVEVRLKPKLKKPAPDLKAGQTVDPFTSGPQ